MPLSSRETGITIVCGVMNYSCSCATPTYLCSLKLLQHGSDFGCVRQAGRRVGGSGGEEAEGKKGEWWEEGQESEQAANCVNKRWMFYPIFSSVIWCYTVVERLIHNSAIHTIRQAFIMEFFFFNAMDFTHDWIRSPSAICKVLLELPGENSFNEFY